MPTYNIECSGCGEAYEKRLSFTQYDAVKAGAEVIPCRRCNSNAEVAFNPGRVGFVLKEGESGGWASKSIKENTYRMQRRETMAKREKDHVFKSSLQANYEGVETGTWREAQELARKEKGEASATTYDGLVKQERPSP